MLNAERLKLWPFIPYKLKKDIFCIPERKIKAQAFLYEDINSSSSNFIFLPKLEIE